MDDDSIHPIGFRAISGDISQTPLSVSTILSRLNHERDELWQFRLYLDIGEAYIKIVAAWLLNRARSEPRNRDSEALRKLIENLKTPTSLGNWLGVIKETSKSNFKAGDFERTVANSLTWPIEGIVKIRNEDAHRATPARAEISRKLDDLKQYIEELTKQVTKSELVFECVPVRKSALTSPAWGRFIVSYSSIRTDLFPWIVAVYAKDEPTALFAYDKRTDKKEPLYIDLAASDPPSTFPPDPQQITSDEFRAIFDVGDAPVFFESLIAARSGERMDSSYIQRTPLVNRILDAVATDRGKVVFLRGDAGSGKTSLCCQIVSRLRREADTNGQLLVLHHFCGRDSSISDSSKKTLENLAAQLSHAQNAGQGQSFSVLAKEAIKGPGRIIRIIIDGLDEVEDAARGPLLGVICDLVVSSADCDLKVILAGQPKIEGDHDKFLRVAVNTILVDGLTLEEVRALANKHELWNQGWTDSDSRSLLKHTSGLALYIESFLRDVARGNVRREIVSDLPLQLSSYWEKLIKRSIHSVLPEEKLDEKIDETHRILGQVHSKHPDLLPKELK